MRVPDFRTGVFLVSVKDSTDKFVQCFIQISLSGRRLACYPSIYTFSFINKTDNVRNTEAHSCDHFCSGKAISVINSVCVFVAVGIQHAMRLRNIVVCGLPDSTIFLHIISQRAQFSKKKKTIIEGKIQSGPKKCIHSLLINIFGINLNEISISG